MPNLAVPAPPESLFKLKFHQVAIYHHDPDEAVAFWKDAGFINWIEDECQLECTEFGQHVSKREIERFNYDILPLELCYMRYSTGQFHSRDPRNGRTPFIGHMAAYVEDLEAQMQRLEKELHLYPYSIYQSVSHQNPYLVERGITFDKCIYNTTHLLGFDVKLTQKVYHHA